MRCPECNSDSQVYDSRLASTGYVRRRRKCVECSHRWATVEVPEGEMNAVNSLLRVFEKNLHQLDAYMKRKRLKAKRSVGIVVPEDRRGEYALLTRTKGLSRLEAMTAMGLLK